MRLLLINHYAGTPGLGMEFRPYHLAREWVRAGHEVEIWAASHSHVRSRQPQPGRERIDGIDYRWFKTPAYKGNGGGRLRNVLSFLRQTWLAAGRLPAQGGPEVVIASSTYPMDIWVARRAARRSAARLVFELHDLWPLSLIELSGMSPGHPFARWCALAERTACREADLVVSMLPCVRAHLAERGLDPSRLVIVPNGVSPADWDAPPPTLRDDVAQALAAHRRAGRAVLGYAGSMGLPNALDTLLDAAGQLGNTPLGLVMVGDGHERARLQRRIADEGLADRVQCLPPIPKAQVPAFLAALDVAYLGWQRVPIYRFGIAPNKLMDYMMAGVPVLHAVEAGNDPVAEADCGISVAPESPAALLDGLRRLMAIDPDQRRAMGLRGQAHVRAHHAWPLLAQRFIDAVQAAMPRRGAP